MKVSVPSLSKSECAMFEMREKRAVFLLKWGENENTSLPSTGVWGETTGLGSLTAGDGIPDIGTHVPSWPAVPRRTRDLRRTGAAGAPAKSPSGASGGRAKPRPSLPSVSLQPRDPAPTAGCAAHSGSGSSTWQAVALACRRCGSFFKITTVSLLLRQSEKTLGSCSSCSEIGNEF